MAFVLGTAMADKTSDKEAIEFRTSSTTALSGTVVDEATNEALVGVKVELAGTDKVAYTDFDGNYAFENLEPGTYTVKASYVSYKETSIEKLTLYNPKNQVLISLKATN